MREEEPELEGLDLSCGIAPSALAEGAMLPGHARVEPVVLVRRGDEPSAIGTAYSGSITMLRVDGLLP